MHSLYEHLGVNGDNSDLADRTNILEKTETMQCLIAINIRCTVPRTAEKDKK